MPVSDGRLAVTTVVLVDDQGLVRAGFRALLDSEDDIEVVGQAADGQAGLELVRRLRPDIVLMDIRMPVLDGLAATARITSDADLADTRVVVLTTFELDEYVFGALRAGASGFLLKDVEPTDLLTAVRVVAGGEALLAPRLTRRLIEAFVAGGGAGALGAGPAGEAQRAAAAAVGRAHPPRARGADARRAGTVQRRDRRAAGRLAADRQDPRRAAVRQARGARPRAAGGDRLRVRAGRRRLPAPMATAATPRPRPRRAGSRSSRRRRRRSAAGRGGAAARPARPSRPGTPASRARSTASPRSLVTSFIAKPSS